MIVKYCVFGQNCYEQQHLHIFIHSQYGAFTE